MENLFLNTNYKVHNAHFVIFEQIYRVWKAARLNPHICRAWPSGE